MMLFSALVLAAKFNVAAQVSNDFRNDSYCLPVCHNVLDGLLVGSKLQLCVSRLMQSSGNCLYEIKI